MVEATSGKVRVVWKTKKSEADRILGKRGRPLLDEMVEHMKQVANDREWPLKRIDVCYWQDVEISKWELIRLVMVFGGNPDMAPEYWESYLSESNEFGKRLGKAKKKAFIEKFGMGFEPA